MLVGPGKERFVAHKLQIESSPPFHAALKKEGLNANGEVELPVDEPYVVRIYLNYLSVSEILHWRVLR